MKNIICKYFDGFDNVFTDNFSSLVTGVLHSASASPASIARSLSAVNGKTFRANIKMTDRILQDHDFQINDHLFRKYINLLFASLKERGLIKLQDEVLIKVAYTTDTDAFLILEASVDFHGRSVPLYFSMRLYPKTKGQCDQKKLERAFMHELRHLLPKKYTYTIVADRGFGHDRVAQLCEEFGFNYVLRISEDLNIEIDGRRLNLESFAGANTTIDAYVCAWNRPVKFEVKTENKSTWFLFSNSSFDKNLSKIYEKHFATEKCFQDRKSSGFNFEKMKIRKYDRFKRIYFTVCLAQLGIVIK
jgi:hypothetical protein